MKKKLALLPIILIVLVFIHSCVSTEKSQRALKLSAQVGVNHGGITENTDMSVVSGVKSNDNGSIDAYTGATKVGINAGVHVNKPLRYGEIESGLNYMYNSQVFTYADDVNNFAGSRKFNVNQLLIPFTYNFCLLKRSIPDLELQFKIGYLGQANFIVCKSDGNVPNYSLNNWSQGATMGISAYPVKLNNGGRLGFFLDIYRGSIIYTDYYNQAGFEMPGSSFVKGGIRYRFK